MSIPLDRLYHYILDKSQEIHQDNVIIYRFFPHGSKNINDLSPLFHEDTYWSSYFVRPHIYCNDQEPLNYDHYQTSDRAMPGKIGKSRFNDLIKSICPNLPKGNLRGSLVTVHDKTILIHSEKRSADLEKYQANNYIPVYYWSHAVIARDWFRYAEHVQLRKQVERRFLIYNRAWSGTREYRLGFADQLIMNGLVDKVLMRVSPVDSTLDQHYDLHRFEHPHWRPQNVIEKHFPLCEAESHYSADFDQHDYESTDIEVVLETLFDDQRLHLTEKTLRPIAMGQPFILAGTYGSLKYLRDYGFKTYADCWDESYDLMTDSVDRMNKIVEIMSDIIAMPLVDRERMLIRAQEIAEYNRRHFFSKEFETQLDSELTQNLTAAFRELEKTNTGTAWLEQNKKIFRNPRLEPVLSDPTLYLSKELLDSVDAIANQYKLRSLSAD